MAKLEFTEENKVRMVNELRESGLKPSEFLKDKDNYPTAIQLGRWKSKLDKESQSTTTTTNNNNTDNTVSGDVYRDTLLRFIASSLKSADMKTLYKIEGLLKKTITF